MSAFVRLAGMAGLLLGFHVAPVVAAATPADTGNAQQCPRRPVPITSLAMGTSDYPLLSVMNNEQGRVVLDFEVAPDGSVVDMKIANSSGFARLDGAALDVAKQHWRYNPVMLDGNAISCRWKIVVDWRLASTPEQLAATGPFTILHMGPSDYPSDALAKHEEGATAVMAFVDENGKVLQARVTQSSQHPDLDKASLDAVQSGKWKITPAQLAGKPVRMLIGLVFVWSISAQGH
jgi:TonB family protein